MRLVRLLLLTLLAAVAPAATASGQVDASFSTAGVTPIKNILKHFDGAGGRLVGDRFYVTTTRDLTVYDVSTPEDPRELGTMQLPEIGSPQFAEEDPDTNGEILLVSNGDLSIIDVSDPADMSVIGTLPDANQHTWTCVLDCTYGYGSGGLIADLRDPRNPKLVGDWSDQYDPEDTHDVTEVKPGVVLTASRPMFLLDARETPAKPGKISETGVGGRFIHQVKWPNAATDGWMLAAGESVGPGCSDDSSSTTTTWRADAATGTFTEVDRFAMSPGLPTDGRMVESTFCTHWLDEHPAFRDGGLLAQSWYEHGTRVLSVAADGQITEVGHYLPVASQASGAYWITDRIVYVVDYVRGLDVVRYDGALPAPAAEAPVEPHAAKKPKAKKTKAKKTKKKSKKRNKKGRRK